MYEIMAMLLEGRNSVKTEFIVSIYLYSGARYYQRRNSLVGFEKLFGEVLWYGDKMSLEVFRVLDDQGRVDDSGERLV